MPLFTHIETGFAVDLLEDETLENYRKRFSDDLLEKFEIVEADLGTLPGATYANGSFSNPRPADPPAKTPITLSKTAFNKLGWSQVGMPRHQAILENAKARTGTTDLDYEVRAAYQQYESANDFEKSEVKSLSDLLVVAGIMTTDEQSKYMTGWPTT